MIAFAGLRGEVNNGGFDQWFLNGAGDLAPDALGFVEELEHLSLCQLLREALAQFSSPYPKDGSLRHLELLSFETDWDATLAERYYAIEEEESLDALMDHYVARSWSDFFDDLISNR